MQTHSVIGKISIAILNVEINFLIILVQSLLQS